MVPPAHRRGSPALAVVTAIAAVVVLLAGVVTAIVRQSDDSSDVAQTGAGTTTTTAESSAPAATVAPAPDEPPQIRELRQQVAEIRGLAWKAPLEIAVLPSPQFVQELQRVIDRDRDPTQEAGESATLKLLKVIPQDLDYSGALDDLYSGSVLGFYDTITKELFVRDSGGGELGAQAKMTLAHELDHALTDQHFGFGPRIDGLFDAGRYEEVAGFLGLVEGDARLVDNLWMDRYMTEEEQVEAIFGGGGDVSAALEVPAFMLRRLNFPYDDGTKFVEEQVDSGGFARVDQLYANPPTSTEQILHPELYAAGQGWTPPPLPDLAATTGCEAVFRSTFGEFDMSLILDSELGGEQSREAAEGWNGDAVQVVRCGNAAGLVDRWQADNEADASELVGALREWAGSWAGSEVGPEADGRFAGEGGAGRVVRSGTRVDLVLAANLATADRIIAAVR